MARHWFYVVDVGGEWEVRVQTAAPQVPRLAYPDSFAATDAAERIAKAEWNTTQEPTGVRIQTGLGGWRDTRTFGRL